MHKLQRLFLNIALRITVKDSDRKPVTYGEVSGQIDVIASELLRKGVEPATRVATFQHPTVFWVASVFATLKIGTVHVLHNSHRVSDSMDII